MANEARVQSGLAITKRDDNNVPLLDYQARPTQFTATVDGTKGPTPGAIAVTTAGTDIDLSQLSQPGFCRLMNQDTTNFVEVGIWDPSTLTFYPLIELSPGESYVIKFSRNLQEAYSNTGTGTSAATKQVRAKANGATVSLLVEAFEA